MLKLYELGKNIETSKIINRSLTNGPGGLLHDQITEEGAYVLLPNDSSYNAIRNLWQNIFDEGKAKSIADSDSYVAPPLATSTSTETPATATSSTAQKQTLEPQTSYQDEKAALEIQNGTFIAGWAAQEYEKLRQLGFKMIKFGNASMRNYSAVTIYDLSHGKYPLTIAELEKIYNVQATTKIPATFNSTANILIILGK